MSKIHILHNWCLQVFKFFRLILVATATNVISEPFPWSALNRSGKTCLALQYIRVVVCRTALFHKSTFILTTVDLNLIKMSFQETFETYYHYCAFIGCQQRKVWYNLDKKNLTKISRKRGKIVYLCKGVNVNFFIMFQVLPKLQ